MKTNPEPEPEPQLNRFSGCVSVAFVNVVIDNTRTQHTRMRSYTDGG